MKTIKCKYCGGSVTLTDAGHGSCDYCGQELTFPSLKEERALAMYERAAHFRAAGEFDRAYQAYQHLMEENPADPELHWNMLLCRYGAEYVEDVRLSNDELGIHEYKPTISRMSFDPIQEDPDYKAVMQYASESSRHIYRREAGLLARIQSGYLEIARKEQPYDVFISYKEQNSDGSRTKAAVLGQEIYEQLTGKGLYVFFSRITLENKLSDMYEPYIYAALRSAKVMLLVADSKEQVNARWVKNEWSRFLAMSREDRSRMIIPVYNSQNEQRMTPYDFPDEIPARQAQDMGKIGAMQDLVRGVCKLTGHEQEERAVVLEGGITIDKLLRRVNQALKDREFQEAEQLLDQVFDIDVKNGQAYLYQFLTVYKVSTLQELVKVNKDWHSDRYYQRVKQFGSERILAELRTFEENCKKEAIRLQALDYMNQGKCADAIRQLEQIRGYLDTEEMMQECMRRQMVQAEMERYRAEVGDGENYLENKFKELQPEKYREWRKLCNLEANCRDTDGNHLMLIAAVVMLAYAVYGAYDYWTSVYFSADETCIIWAIIGGITTYLMKDRYSIVTNGILPAIGLFLFGEVLDMLYVEKMISVKILPIGIIAVSVLFVGYNWKKGQLALRESSIMRQKQEYYNNVVAPIEDQLKREHREKWAPRIGANKLVKLKSIQ